MPQRNYGDIALASMQDELEKIAAKERYILGEGVAAIRRLSKKLGIPSSDYGELATLQKRLNQPSSPSERAFERIAERVRGEGPPRVAGPDDLPRSLEQRLLRRMRLEDRPGSPVIPPKRVESPEKALRRVFSSKKDFARAVRGVAGDIVENVGKDPMPNIASIGAPGVPLSVPYQQVRGLLGTLTRALSGRGGARAFGEKVRRSPAIPESLPIFGGRYGPKKTQQGFSMGGVSYDSSGNPESLLPPRDGAPSSRAASRRKARSALLRDRYLQRRR